MNPVNEVVYVKSLIKGGVADGVNVQKVIFLFVHEMTRVLIVVKTVSIDMTYS